MTAPPLPTPSPWRWVPSLYFAQGLPYVAVMTLAVVMYKNLGVANADLAFYTSWLYLPWVVKPLWSPLVELVGAKRRWIVGLQFAVGAALAAVALTVPGPDFFRWTLAFFWLLAFASATHDIAADGFYLLALPAHRQAAFVGVRSTCYRLAMIAGQGGLVWLAGAWQARTGSFAQAWSWVFGLAAVVFGGAALYHRFALPRPEADRPAPASRSFGREWLAVFAEFFRKKEIGAILAFLLLYRLAEAQLVKLVVPFLLDGREAGGLALTTQQVGVLYGTIGVVALTLGGLLGGWAISRRGLRALLWPMILCLNLPNVVYVLLAWRQPDSLLAVGAGLAAEQFGYGFGFAAYLVYMMMVADGPHRTAHYALCTGFMALGMMLPGLFSGDIQQALGYTGFFVWVCVATLPSFAAAALVKIDPAFGKKTV